MKFSIIDFYKSLFPRYVVSHEAVLLENAICQFSWSLPAGSRVLDAGAGEMQYKKYFSHCNYVAVDVAYDENNWDYSGLDFVLDLEDMKEISDESFDAVLCTQVLEHVKHPARVVSEFYRILRRGGVVFLTAPQCFEDHQEPHNYFNFTKYGITLLLQEAGFKVEAAEYFCGYFYFLAQWLNNFWFRFGDGYIVKLLDIIFYPFYFVLCAFLIFLDKFDKKKKLAVNLKAMAVKRYEKSIG